MLESIVGEPLSLARKKPLSNRDLAKAKELMVKLRNMGFTNREISGLTNGGWSEPTVKLYTRGTAVEDPSPKENAVKLPTQLVSMGLTLNDVRTAVSMRPDLDAKGISFGDVPALLEEAKRFKVSEKGLIGMHKGLKDSHLSIGQLGEAIPYKSQLRPPRPHRSP